MVNNPRVAIVTGGNRGIGFEICRRLAMSGHRVILASRDQAKGEAAAKQLSGQQSEVICRELDVANQNSILAFCRSIEADFSGADILINNAAINLDKGKSVLNIPMAWARETMETNFFGPLALCQMLVPGMIQRRYGRVVNVSSERGQLVTMSDYSPIYSASKAALNALTRLVASAGSGTNVLVNSVNPGWVRTDMGGSSAPRSIEESVDTILWLGTLPDDGPTGGFYVNRELMAW